jgi:hypothetical protein
MELEFTRLKEWLDGAGADWPGLMETARVGETIWLLAFDDELSVAVEWLEGISPRIVLSTPIGVPPVDRRFVVYEILLSLNALWRENNEMRASLEAAGELVLTGSADPPDATVGGLQQLIAAWRQTAAEWREFVNAPAQAVTVPGLHPSFLGLRV